MSSCPDPLSALLLAACLQARPPDLYAKTFCRQPAENHLDRHHYHTTTSSGNTVEPVTGSVSDEIGERIGTPFYTPWRFQA